MVKNAKVYFRTTNYYFLTSFFKVTFQIIYSDNKDISCTTLFFTNKFIDQTLLSHFKKINKTLTC